MEPFFSFPFGSCNPVRTSWLIFCMYVFGTMLFCAGFLLSIFGFQSCQSDNFANCSMTWKVLGPALAVIGLGSVLLARSRARLEARRRESDQINPDSSFLCGYRRQLIQFIIFGLLFIVCGVLINIMGVWVPGCSMRFSNQNVTGTDSNDKNCGLRSLQIMGPLIILIGLCFFVVAYVQKKRSHHNSNDSDIDVESQSQADTSFHITVGDEVIIFPPPPPSYFADPLSPVTGQDGRDLLRTDNPPSYYSIFNIRTQHPVEDVVGDHEGVYTVPLPIPSSESNSNACFPSDPPPKYEEKDPAEPDPGTLPVTSTDPAESSPSPGPPCHSDI
ncbi:transmembrane protein 171 [Mixophyes fleayi]|uniref:transmembrane protein 171 n=1 Tax=Mixophyes fleayi TaxID=3061075 RepID=UPI003F4E299A